MPKTNESPGRRFSLTRFAMYNSLEAVLTQFPAGQNVLMVSEGTEPSIRRMFPPDTRFTVTAYPPTDVTDLNEFADGQFDCAVTDQVLEHVRQPWKALAELRRVLVPGGMAINTSCCFNPVHHERDFYRFMPDGFRALHEDFFGTVLLCQAWGNREAIGHFALHGTKSFDVRSDQAAHELAIRSEPEWPWSIWCVARKFEGDKGR
jgi:SAM-dependent methyltransferase